mmetsp:Transcript_9539/g.14096  ORF Transcript_9539/g.14096 Transcript_9539/m.14096 type:complete len:80 (+) Transcript_9539:619-858(+)
MVYDYTLHIENRMHQYRMHDSQGCFYSPLFALLCLLHYQSIILHHLSFMKNIIKVDIDGSSSCLQFSLNALRIGYYSFV